MNTNNVIIDWLTFTSKIHSTDNIINMLGLNKPGIAWQTVPGLYGYKSRLVFGNISIMYDGFSEDMGICVSMSGQGCRDFETYADCEWSELFNEIDSAGEDMKVTRIDIAYDDFDGLLDINTICDDVLNHNYVSPLSKWEVCHTSEGSSAYIGSPASPFRLRFYDKALERGFTDGRHWIRCEMQLRKNRASAFVKMLVDSDIDNFGIGELFAGVLNNYIRFVSPSADSNLSRRDTAPWWLLFVENLNKISIFVSPGTEYNEINLENYVVKQAGNSIYTYLVSFGFGKFINKLTKRGTVLNVRQQRIINKYNKLSNDDLKSYFDNLALYFSEEVSKE